jgi:GTPase SAR1 family protein
MIKNTEWLSEAVSHGADEEYLLFDCPGQIELYTHMTIFQELLEMLHSWDIRVCGVFLLDSQFMVDGAKFLSGTTTALSVMINLQIPHVNVLSKIDLLSKSAKKQLDK